MDKLFMLEKEAEGVAKGAFILLHGMESHSGWFDPLFPLLQRAGYTALAYDRPGWGRSEGIRGHIDSYKDILETLSHIASNARRRYGHVHLAGMSWGGMAALYASLRRPWLFDSLTLIAPGIAAKADLPFLAKFHTAAHILTGNFTATLPTAFTPEHFTASQEWQDFIRTDPHLVTQVSAGFCLETVKMRRFIGQAAGKRTLPPALCLLADNDKILDNHNVAKVCQRAGVVQQTLPDSQHTLVFENPEAVATALLQQAQRGESPSSADCAWIAGAGAIGGLTASLLSFDGVKTGILVKEKYRERVQKSGITLTSGQGVRTTGSSAFFESRPENLPPDPELLVIAVKSFDTDTLLKELSGTVPARTVIASLQNGLGNEMKIAEAFPDNTIIAASICAGVEMPAPGNVLWPDDRGGLAAAVYRGDGERAKAVWKNMLSRTGMECVWIEGERAAERLKWSKLMLNIGFNALNSMTGLTSGQIMSDQVYGKLVVSALREGFSCMKSLDLHPVDLPGYPVSKLGLLVMTPGPVARKAIAWQAKRSTEAAFSMRQDVLKNRQHTEISELNGIIVKTGTRLGLKTPANSWLAEQIEKRTEP